MTTPAPDPIARFRGRYRFLSNFAPCDWVTYDGMRYPTVEHAYQAAKSTSTRVREEVFAQPTAAMAKKMGRHIPLRPHWQTLRLGIMRELLAQKFARGSALPYRQGLVQTGSALLIEGNDWGDAFWGAVSYPAASPQAQPDYVLPDGTTLYGENWLGRVLMELRESAR